MAPIDLILFDIGGVLGTNGWDREQRARAVQHFGLDSDDFEDRHQDTVGWWEEGRLTMDDYLDMTVFHVPQTFTKDQFRAFMFSQSVADPDAIQLAQSLASSGRYTMLTLNNEPAELNQYRIDTFGLTSIFSAFLTSCYLGVRKPNAAIYRHALSITQADPAHTIFIDDRDRNLAPARALGVRTVHFTTVDDARQQLAALGVAPTS